MWQDLLFSYNIAVDRSEEMKRVLGKSAASVGLQLPDVYQPWCSGSCYFSIFIPFIFTNFFENSCFCCSMITWLLHISIHFEVICYQPSWSEISYVVFYPRNREAQLCCLCWMVNNEQIYNFDVKNKGRERFTNSLFLM